MATVSGKNFENNDVSASLLKEIYGDSVSTHAPRFPRLRTMYAEFFGSAEISWFSSPGRIEIVGNHTDHNGGKVLAAAINVDTLAAASPRDDGRIEVKSQGYPMLSAHIDDLAFRLSEIGTSTALIKGVAEYYVRAGKRIGGFSACMDSCVPKGSGVSSSSSFELMIAEILNQFYNDGALDPVFKAKAAQYAENTYFGKPCGLMDQCAIALGGVNMIDFRSFDKPIVEKTVWRLKNLDIFVVQTGGDHADLTEDYAAIPADMKYVAKTLGGKVLRDIAPEAFSSRREELRSSVPEGAILRAEHFYEENKRVEKAFEAVAEGDNASFLDAVNTSGESSASKLKNLYSPSSGDRSLYNALKAVGNIKGVAAKRVHGGGFAGTMLLFVEKQRSSAVNDELISWFGKENVFRLSVRDSGARML